ncbi:MAG: twin-arginine translocase subunit TatC [Deltaproteobacteria bacterium]|nr:twin-arginine translocase subunit TatC [Deltaproteobacteria bacterium]
MNKMSLAEHLEELRRRLMWSLLFFFGGLLLAFSQRKFFLDLANVPHRWAMGHLNLPASQYVFRYQDAFISQFKVCVVFGFILVFPFILHQILRFVMAGLFPQERKKLLYFYLPSFLILFLSGAAFAYFFLVPYGLHFLALFGTQVGLTPMINFNEYVTLLLILVLMTGSIFELPVMMALLVRIGVVSARTWRKKQKLAILIIFIGAAVLTPTPDPLTQALLAVPLIILYESGYWVSVWIEKRKLIETNSPVSAATL